MDKESPSSNLESRGKPRKKWRRRALWVFVITPIGLTAGGLILAQTPMMKVIVEPVLSGQLGIDVSTKSIKLSPTGELIIRDAICTTDSITNRAGTLIEIEKATIQIDWWGLIRGEDQVRSIQIDKPVLRMSQDSQSGVLNFVAIKPKSGGSGGGAIPAISITRGVIEIGEHDQNGYRLLKELSIQGQITHQNESGESGFDLIATQVEPSMSGPDGSLEGVFGLKGLMKDNGIEGVIDGIRLQDWPADIVPSRSRGMYGRLALEGNLKPTRFSVTSDGLVRFVLTLDGVALNLPIDDAATRAQTDDSARVPEPAMRMKNTHGVIVFGSSGLEADLSGLIDELEYDVELKYDGLESTSPFDAMLVTDFRLKEGFTPIRFLPDSVVSKLERFEYPTADIHAMLSISRGGSNGDGDQSEIRVSGRAELSNGSATYRKFRYPFHDLSGVIEFDPDQLIVKNIRGIGPTGAMMSANGLFAPLGEHSNVNLDIQVNGVGLDEHMLNAMDSDQRELVNALFNTQEYAQLIDDGLVLTPGQYDELQSARRSLVKEIDRWMIGVDGDERDRALLVHELDELDELLEIPVFDFGGSADVDVKLVRHPERPSDDRWTTDIEVRLAPSGIVSEHFPIPIVARDVVIQIDDDHVSLKGGQYQGVDGGIAQVGVEIDTTVRDAKPIIDIEARGFPIDQRLIAAIPGYRSAQSLDPDDISLRRILDRIGLEGMIDCDAIIGPRSNGKMGYDVEATIFEGAARPARVLSEPVEQRASSTELMGTHPIILDDLLGTVYVTEEFVIVDLNGMLTAPAMPLAPTPIELLTQLTLTRKLDVENEFGPPSFGPEIYASAYADGIDLAMPLEHAISVVSPRIARDVRAKMIEHEPDGVLGMDVKLEGVIGGTVESIYSFDRVEGLSFDYDDHRYQVGSSWGRAQFVVSSEPSLEFDEFRVSIGTESLDTQSELSLDGSLPLARGGRYIELNSSSALTIDYKQGSFDSPLTQIVVSQISPSGAQWCDDHQFGGVFDLGVVLDTQSGAYRLGGEPDQIRMLPIAIEGELFPRSMTLSLLDEIAEFDELEGMIRFQGFEGTIDQIRAKGDRSEMGINGVWSQDQYTGIGFDLDIRASGDLLTGPTRVLFPESIDRVMNRLEIESSDPVYIDSLHMVGKGIGTDSDSLHVDGSVRVSDANAMLGLPITELAGDIGFKVDKVNEHFGYEINLDASRLRAGSMRIHGASASIIGDAENIGVVLVPEIRASMHGGQIAGSAQIYPETNDESQYWLELHASGVRASPVFDDLLLPPEGLVGPPIPGQESVLSAWSKGQDLSKGAMIGDLTLTGVVGDPDQRNGRGLVRISGGSVVALPGLINLIEASNLSLPTGAALDYAEAAFYVDGPSIAFEQLSASSTRVEILGYGTMDSITRDIDLRFHSRSTTPIPIVSKLLEDLRDELITTRVSGNLKDPVYSVQAFESTLRLFDSMLGRPLSDHQIRFREVEEQVRESQLRTKRDDEERSILPVSGAESSDESWGWIPE